MPLTQSNLDLSGVARIVNSLDPTSPQELATKAYVDASISGVTVGDCKSGLQATDHNGWILLNGRLKSALTSTQQSAATSLGIGVNLPDATGRGFVQGTLGAQIGSSTITQTNLPNINLTGGSHSHVTSFGSWTTNLSSAGGERYLGGTGNGTNTAFNRTSNASGNISIPLGGSGAAYTPASIGVNQFVFLSV